jgi:hypothetical protein
MFITVMYRNGKVGMVGIDQLDELIRSHKVIKFMRSEGWVSIGIDPIREFDEDFTSPEKRQYYKKTK